MYWKGLRTTVQSHVKKCHSFQVNKCRQHKYGKLPAKLTIANPWEGLCVDLIGPYTLKGKTSTNWLFCASQWSTQQQAGLKLPELDIPIRTKRQTGKGTCIQTKQPYFNKMSALVGTIVNTTWFSHYPSSQYIINNNRSEFKLHFETLCDSYQYQEPRSKHNTKVGASNNHGNALPSWNLHGQNNHWE